MIRSTVLVLLLLSFCKSTFAVMNGNDTTIRLQTEHGELKLVHKKNSMYALFTFSPSETVIAEAELKNIKEDNIYVGYVVDQNCQITSITIKRTGMLDSFNKEAVMFCDEMLRLIQEKQLSKYFFIDGAECEDTIFKIRFILKE